MYAKILEVSKMEDSISYKEVYYFNNDEIAYQRSNRIFNQSEIPAKQQEVLSTLERLEGLVTAYQTLKAIEGQEITLE
jgi:hypothetical protein